MFEERSSLARLCSYDCYISSPDKTLVIKMTVISARDARTGRRLASRCRGEMTISVFPVMSIMTGYSLLQVTGHK